MLTYDERKYKIPPIAERVANGARWLDTLFPGWESRIDPDSLRMDSATACICGQSLAELITDEDEYRGIGDGYDYALDALREQHDVMSEGAAWVWGLMDAAGGTTHEAEEFAVLLGFESPVLRDCTLDIHDAGYYETKQEYDEIGKAWIELLAERKAGA